MKARLTGAGVLALLLAVASPARADVDVGFFFSGAIHGDGYSLYLGVPFGYLATRPHYTRHYYRYDYPRPYYRDYYPRYRRYDHPGYRNYGHRPHRHDRYRHGEDRYYRGDYRRGDALRRPDRRILRDDHGGRHHDFFRGERHR
ncbi:hypothetical protein GCM10011348_38320 [Marinobacterium nitratireducens]|uniref:Uncharacterized protein n=1 Tax=Marinobacterium nitratireducens TaxID=518897 RepID=A0A918DXK9_9GAMM|nr:hypothetical protein [Marinobacterium nitratireducens]GGO86748.1 hypothetical protein GCM10011348_38320 [Marinobacterium nitratireducens]